MRKAIQFLRLLPFGILMSGPFALWGSIISFIIGVIIGALVF